MPTSATWGRNSYMLRDAQRGQLEQIPAEVMPYEIATDDVWECTRLVIADHVMTQAERAECLSLIVGGLIEIAHENGGVELVSLSPLPLVRALRQLGFPASRLGEPYYNEADQRKYAVLSMPATHTSHLIAAE